MSSTNNNVDFSQPGFACTVNQAVGVRVPLNEVFFVLTSGAWAGKTHTAGLLGRPVLPTAASGQLTLSIVVQGS